MKRRGRVLWAMTTTHVDTWKLKRRGGQARVESVSRREVVKRKQWSS